MIMERFRKPFFIFVATLATIGLVIISILLVAPKSPLPNAIRKQANFVILAPTSGPVLVNRESTKYDNKLKLFSYDASLDSINIVISQQPTPESFIDIPQVYDKIVANMNEYTKFDAIIGTIHLTRPTDLGGKQAAVVNTKGTLMFAKPEKDLSEDQWRQFFNGVDVLR